MKTVWKFPLDIMDKQEVDMPAYATVLHVDAQAGLLTLWALVESTHATEPRTFRVFGTGHQIQGEPGKYIGTVLVADGALVWHVFEV